jgi:hypothetical protein
LPRNDQKRLWNPSTLNMSANQQSNGEQVEKYDDPFRHTSLIPYVDVNTAPPAVADRIRVLPFRRNIFLLLGHSEGLFPHLAGVIGGCFNGNVRKIPLLDWVSLIENITLTKPY